MPSSLLVWRNVPALQTEGRICVVTMGMYAILVVPALLTEGRICVVTMGMCEILEGLNDVLNIGP